jgi:trehalose 6-phosphate phosphatase
MITARGTFFPQRTYLDVHRFSRCFQRTTGIRLFWGEMIAILQHDKPATAIPPFFDLSHIALLLDVDGTLLDLAARPDGVRVPEDLRIVLKQLSGCARCVLAFVSGRPVAQLDSLFSPLKLSLIGCHGAEMRILPESPVVRRAPLDDAIRSELHALAARFRGTLLEDKGFSIAIHYRAALEQKGALLTAVQEFVRAHAELEWLAGKAVIEFKQPGYDKATACAELLRHAPFAGRRPLFLGDDVTDEAVFRALPQFSGIGISVGRCMEGAQYMLDSPAAVRTWLRDLAAKGAR